MVAKAVLVVFAQALFVQSITCYCGASPFGPFGRYASGIYESPYAPFNAVASASASHRGALPVASSSPLPPNGVSVLSENRFEGPLAVVGELPFLGTVAVEGSLPTRGSGAVNFGAGNGNIGITREDVGYGYGICGGC